MADLRNPILNSSIEMAKVPSMKLRFALNNSFVVQNPIFKIYDNQVTQNVFFFILL